MGMFELPDKKFKKRKTKRQRTLQRIKNGKLIDPNDQKQGVKPGNAAFALENRK